jgi:hypothetical protein
MFGAEDFDAAGDELFLEGDGIVDSSRRVVAAGEVVACPKGVGVLVTEVLDTSGQDILE